MKLQRNPALKQPAGSPRAGKLIMPFGWGVVLTAITRICDEQGQGRALDHMAVIYRSTAQANALSAACITFASGESAKCGGTLYGSEGSVKIVGMHSGKGLEFGMVSIPSLGDMPKKGEEEADESRLLYLAMTRAIDRLAMAYRKPSSFTRKIQDSIGSVRQHLDEMDSQKVAGRYEQL